MKISPLKWTGIGIIWILVALGIWQSSLPYFAERNYREGYNHAAAQLFKEAIPYLEKAVELAPWETQFVSELGKAYEDYGNLQSDLAQKQHYFKEAEKRYIQTINLDDKNPWFYSRYGALTRQMITAFPEQAQHFKDLTDKLYFQAAELDPKNPLFQLNLAYYYHQLNMIEDAKKYYLICISMDPRMSVARFNLANIYYLENQLDKSIEQYLEIHKYEPQFKNLSLAIALVYSNQNKYAEALPYLEESKLTDPNNEEILKNLAYFYFYIQAYDKSAQTYEELFRRFPAYQKPFKDNYLRSLLKIDEVNRAYAFLFQYTQLFPEDGSAKAQLQKMKAYQTQ